MPEKQQIVIYTTKSGQARLEVKLIDEMVWLSQKQISELFDKDVRTVSEHIQNIFLEGELNEKSVIRNFRTTAVDGKKYDTKFYNLDVIISVGYRVKSKQGTEFRIWATKTLRDHILKGFTINQQRLRSQHQARLQELQSAIGFLRTDSMLWSSSCRE
ncbi:MAG: RhuM family protein [Candidatus Uhrbacteria bacterium]